ncbi:PmoA family protein [Candidatus Bathyarchaeota archaeon]|nr:PmoA family protein [Candidatus Bathyarchaeota archaeon]
MTFELKRIGDVVEVREDNELVSRYLFNSRTQFKPYFYPLNAPSGLCITEDSPEDHVHHRSMWTAHGDVNGIDFWTETSESGKQIVKIVSIKDMEDFGIVESNEVWITKTGSPVIDVFRRFIFRKTLNGLRIIDVEVDFTASYSDIKFGDTKEGGIISLRVTPSMREVTGGIIRNSRGDVGEGECWGKRAEWCDYTGSVNGKTVGIAIFDHPSNLRYPTYWHVRAYGLFAANPFGISYFEGDKSLNGSLIIGKGGCLRFKYRVLAHLGVVDSNTLNKVFIDHCRIGG